MSLLQTDICIITHFVMTQGLQKYSHIKKSY